MALSFAVQFIIAMEKYNAPISWIKTDKGFAIGTPSNASRTSGANKANIPARASIRLLDVINNFVFKFIASIKTIEQFQYCVWGMLGCLVLLLLNERQPDQAGNHYSNIADARKLLKHHQYARQRSDRQDIAESGCC